MFSCSNQIFGFSFKLIYLRSIAKQVIPTYINHSRPLIPDGIHFFFFWTRFERREEPDLSLYAERQARKHLVPFFITSLVWRGRGLNPRPPAHGANTLTTEPPLRESPQSYETWPAYPNYDTHIYFKFQANTFF